LNEPVLEEVLARHIWDEDGDDEDDEDAKGDNLD
jgi:hypothetical protein